MSNRVEPTNTTAFYAQAAVAFGVAMFAVIAGIYFLPVNGWMRAFLAVSSLFLVSSSFTLAKVVRDAQEQAQVTARLDQARVDKLLAEHDPFAQPACPQADGSPPPVGSLHDVSGERRDVCDGDLDVAAVGGLEVDDLALLGANQGAAERRLR
jgi:hypothetical protein